MWKVSLTNQQSGHPVDRARLIMAAKAVLEGEGVQRAQLSLAVVDEATMARLNRQFLDHEGPTDVLSFPFSRSPTAVEGEVVVCADVAARAAPQYGWDAQSELLLYVIHGVLHLVGYDDRTPKQRRLMRQKERRYLAEFDLVPSYRSGSPTGRRDGRSKRRRGRRRGRGS